MNEERWHRATASLTDAQDRKCVVYGGPFTVNEATTFRETDAKFPNDYEVRHGTCLPSPVLSPVSDAHMLAAYDNG